MVNDKIEISISKTKIIWLLIGSLAFVLLGICILLTMDVKLYEKIIVLIGILFFGSGLFLLSLKLLDKMPGLIMDEYGITDNVTKPKVGIIEWNDISHVEISNGLSAKMLLIFVSNPEKYISRVESRNRRGLKNNFKLLGTPFVIPSSVLNIKLEYLENLIKAELTTINEVTINDEIDIPLLNGLYADEISRILKEFSKLNKYTMVPDIDVWEISYKGLNFIVVDDIIYGTTIRYRCNTEYKQEYLEKAQEIVELVENKIIKEENARKS